MQTNFCFTQGCLIIICFVLLMFKEVIRVCFVSPCHKIGNEIIVLIQKTNDNQNFFIRGGSIQDHATLFS